HDKNLIVPPIPGVIVIPGDIGFLNQFFSVMLMVGNVAPGGSNLVVTNLKADIVLPLGADDVLALSPGESGNAEFLVEGRREGTHEVQMEISGTLNGLPVGPVNVRGR